MAMPRALCSVLALALAACDPPASAQPPTPAHDYVDPSALGYLTFAWPVASLRARSLVLGCGHACVLHAAGTVECWGRNEVGQLGDGTIANRDTPAPVTGLPPVVEIASTCVSTCGRTEHGEVWCWGGGDLGEIGDGNRAGHRTQPVHVSGIVGARALVAQGTGTCAVIDDEGHARCWGTFDDHAGAPLSHAEDADRPRALAIALADPPRLVADSPFRACVIARDHVVSCWGNRECTNCSVAPIDPTTTMDGLGHVHDLAGGSFLTCASDEMGVSCWGAGVMAFGLGGSEPLPPTRVTGLLPDSDLAVGDDFVCGTVGADTRCAGYGELVDSAARVHPLAGTARRVGALTGLHAIVASPSAVCGLDRRLAVHCVQWLSGHEGEPPAPPS
jgi:hypothetical protein